MTCDFPDVINVYIDSVIDIIYINIIFVLQVSLMMLMGLAR